jgi:hypothetical protein
MRTTRRRVGGLLAVLVAGLGTGCLVEVDKVADPRPAFEAARREAERYQGRPGPARQVNVLVYDAADGELVRVSVPMWLVRKAARHQEDWDLGDGRTGDKVRRHVKVEDLERAGLGTLVEVEEDGGDSVLVWLK